MSKSKPRAAKAKQAKQARKPRPNDGELTDDTLDRVAGGVDVCVVPPAGPGVTIAAPFPNSRGPSGAKKNSQLTLEVQEVSPATVVTLDVVPTRMTVTMIR
jgi:hypothetical protein